MDSDGRGSVDFPRYRIRYPVNPANEPVILRTATPLDFADIVSLNTEFEAETSPMDLERLQHLHDLSSYHKVAVVDGQVTAFLIAMREDAPYENDNHGWFRARFERFLYVDRIVVSPRFAGRKIGSGLYRDLFSHARALQLPRVVCEYNIEPPNPASAAFHEKFGFCEVGTQYVANGSKRVSLQAAEVGCDPHTDGG